MLAASDRLTGVRAKIARARHHMSDLEATVKRFRESNPYGFRTSIDNDNGDEVHHIEIRNPTPVDFSILIGDSLHSLRCALDHLAWQAHEAGGGRPDRQTNFPIYKTAGEFKTAELRSRQKYRSELIALLEQVQPYRPGYAPLGVLKELNDYDKHRLMVVTAFALVGVMPTWKTPSGPDYAQRFYVQSLHSGTVEMDLAHPDVSQRFAVLAPVGVQSDGTLAMISDGAEVARIRAPVLKPDLVSISLDFEVAFGEPRVVRGKPVLATLELIATTVGSAVEALTPLL